MKTLDMRQVVNYIEDHIGEFHASRLQCLETMRLKEKLLKKKNPYLFKAKNLHNDREFVRSLTDAFLSSNEETVFGNWIERLAIFINGLVFSGKKSGISGIDLEFDRDGVRYIVTIKSSPSWGNSAQVAKMKTDFATAKRTLRTSQTDKSKLVIEAVNGCCYGRDNNPDKGEYQKLCGERFWEFISGCPTLYLDIIEPLGHQARKRNDEFQAAYEKKLNVLTREFADDFCLADGAIDWDKIVKYNSGK
ncbi:MAG: PmeII family type II restriction endonuclease [Thermoguttaceae bacterium]